MTAKATLGDRDLLAQLVAIDSTSARSNLPIADFICDYLDRPGLRIERRYADTGDKVDLVVTAGPAVDASREGLVLSGHMDAVPPGEGWETDPFELTEIEGAFVGRGTADMKGFLALAINRLASIARDRLRAPLVLLLTRDEEIGTRGARELVRRWPVDHALPRAAVIGEPTALQPVRAHKGRLQLRVTTLGQAAHSGCPQLGKNAIELAGRAVGALAEARQRLRQRRYQHAELFADAPFATLNIGTIDGGTATNVVPDRCRIDLDLRPLPATSSTELVSELRDQLSVALPEAAYRLELTGESRPLLTDERAPIYRLLCELTGERGAAGVCYATDAGWLAELGLDCVLFGPGSIEAAHRPGERLPCEQLARGGDLLARLVSRACVG